MILEAIVLVISVILFRHLIGRLREHSGLPPGPPPLPLIGNFYNIYRHFPKMHLSFKEIATKYGDLFTVYLQGHRVVVVNSMATAREALLTRKDDLAGRPSTFTAGIFSRGYKGIGLTDFNSTLMVQRKIAHSAIRMYSPRLEETVVMEIDELIKRLKEEGSRPCSPRTHVSLTTMNIVCAMVFGERYEIDDPEFLDGVENNHKANAVVGGILDLFPWLNHFPIEDTKALDKLIKSRDRILNKKYHEHKERFDEGSIQDLTDALLKAKLDEEQNEDTTKHVITEDHIIMTMQDMFVAGQETTATAILWLIAYLARFPEVQAKVHAELDDVVGHARIPELKDRANLHFVQATIAETLRYSSLAPLLLPHKATRDTILQGYNIPKETMIFINVWAIHHDKELWDRPDDFDPSRFLDSEGCFTSNTNSAFLPFGAGRRVCLGESIAKRVVFLTAARLFHQFQFKPAANSSLETLEGEGRIVNSPKFYEVLIEERL